MRYRFFSFVIAIAFSLLFSHTAQAISVGPALIDVAVDAGKQTEFSVLVTNEEDQTLSFALTIQKFIPEGNSGRLFFLPPEDTSGLPDWLFLEGPTITLRAGESKRLSVSLRVPEAATPGGHYATIFLTQTSLDAVVGQNVSAIPRIGVLVFATVNGSNVERLSLKDSHVEQPSVSNLPVHFFVEVENQGNVHVQPNIQINVKNVFGQSVAQINGNSVDARVLPGSQRVFASAWNKSSPLISDSFLDLLQQEWKNGGLGWYKAEIQISSRVGVSGFSVVHFQVWPWRSMLLILMAVFFSFISLSILLRKIRGRYGR